MCKSLMVHLYAGFSVQFYILCSDQSIGILQTYNVVLYFIHKTFNLMTGKID